MVYYPNKDVELIDWEKGQALWNRYMNPSAGFVIDDFLIESGGVDDWSNYSGTLTQRTDFLTLKGAVNVKVLTVNKRWREDAWYWYVKEDTIKIAKDTSLRFELKEYEAGYLEDWDMAIWTMKPGLAIPSSLLLLGLGIVALFFVTKKE